MKVITLPLGRMNANCIILADEETGFGAVIDPGGEDSDASAKRIISRCESLGITLKYILLTHAHFDHMLSLSRIRELTGAPLALHEYEAEALADPEISYMSQFAGIYKPEAPAERLLAEGDIITLGSTEIEVLHTPGHTMGSVCYKNGGVIVTGDTLFYGSIGRCDLIGGDEVEMDHSLKRLCRLSGDYKLYPGHGPSTTLSRERESNIYLRHF